IPQKPHHSPREQQPFLGALSLPSATSLQLLLPLLLRLPALAPQLLASPPPSPSSPSPFPPPPSPAPSMPSPPLLAACTAAATYNLHRT
ncbi:unnamed protein product, partial [Closterium sp. NIES-54]